MTWRGRRLGFFEGPPRDLYRRSGPRYFEYAAGAMVLNGLVVSASSS
jgi:hypothetical protein